MSKTYQDTSYEPTIQLNRVEGNLHIKGWDRTELRFDADNADDLEISKDGDRFTGLCRSNLYLRVPTSAIVEIKQVDGDTNIKSVEGDIQVGQLQGNATFKLLGAIEVESIQGNLTASRIEGSLMVTSLEGNATIRDVEEILTIQNMDGNLNYRGMGKEMQCNLDGNATLRLETEPAGRYEVIADGNITCKADIPTGAEIILQSQAEQIRVKTPEGSETINADHHEITMGEGDVDIHLESGGSIDFNAAAMHEDIYGVEYGEEMASLAGDITQQVTDQIETQMAALNDQLSNLSVHFGSPGSEKAQRAAEKARRKVERAQRRLELKLATTQRRAERQARKARPGRPRLAFAPPGNMAQAKSDPVSDEERQTILQMLQDQKINVEEAEMLLSALEGKLDLADETPETPEPPEAPAPPAETEA